MVRIAVIGSRTFNDLSLVRKALERHGKIDLIVSGGASGADTLAERYANEMGIRKLIFPAEWSKHGRQAGFIRNELIIENCDCVYAFWDGKSPGTKHSIRLAKKHGKLVKIVYPNSIIEIKDKTLEEL